MGYTMMAGPEAEFFLFQRRSRMAVPTTESQPIAVAISISRLSTTVKWRAATS